MIEYPGAIGCDSYCSSDLMLEVRLLEELFC
jgi:hypothetical protein